LHAPIAVFFQVVLKKPVLVRLACTGSYGDVRSMRRMRFGSQLVRASTKAKRFIALSREGIEEAVSIGVPRDRVEIIPNGVTLPDEPSCSHERRDGFVMFVGGLRRQKGLDCLLAAFARVEGEWELYLVGEGPERAMLERKARETGIGDRVHFIGEVEDPSTYYAGARLFVLPSMAEGLSNALLEAMTFGLPVVATRIGGNVDVIEDGVNGLLVEPGNVAEMAQAMSRVLRDESFARYLAVNARRTVLGKYTMERVVEQYLRAYRSVLAD